MASKKMACLQEGKNTTRHCDGYMALACHTQARGNGTEALHATARNLGDGVRADAVEAADAGRAWTDMALILFWFLPLMSVCLMISFRISSSILVLAGSSFGSKYCSKRKHLICTTG